MSINEKMKQSEIQFIAKAASYLENPSFVIKLTNIIGMPIEKVIVALPAQAQQFVASATHKALEGSLAAAIMTISKDSSGSFENGQEKSGLTGWGHKIATAVTGGVGGVFGLAALPFELPITTTIMLRSISSIANNYGHDLADLKTRLECLSVFAMGSPSKADDALESAYFGSRIGIAQAINQATKWAGGKTAQEIAEAIAAKSAPELIQLMAKVAARFNIVVTEGALAKAIPGVAIATGVLINVAFTDHFNAVAEYHFGIRTLESLYGAAAVRALYDANSRRD